MKDKNFGKRLQLQRKNKDLKIERLAEVLFVNAGYVRQMEAGEIPSLQLLLTICDTLETSPNHLLGFDSEISIDDTILTELISALTSDERTIVKLLIDQFIEFEKKNVGVGQFSETRFGRKLQNIRLKRNLKVIDIAQNCNKTEGYIRTIESGTRLPSTKLLINLCEVLDTSPNNLLGYIDPAKTELEKEVLTRLVSLTDWQKMVVGHLIKVYTECGMVIKNKYP